MWQNFGYQGVFANMEKMVHTAFDLWHILTLTLPTTTATPIMAAPRKISAGYLTEECARYRDELCISTKAGFEMWDGPYGDRNGSTQVSHYPPLTSSLKRMGLEYVDIFYHHVFDPGTPA